MDKTPRFYLSSGDPPKTKADFMALVKKYFEEERLSEQSLILDDIEIHSKDVIDHYILELRLIPNHPSYSKRFEIFKKDGRDILIRKRKPPYYRVFEILTYEEIYDILTQLHSEEPSKSCYDLRKETKGIYDIPDKCLEWFKECCNICKYKNVPLPKVSEKGIAEMFIVNRFKNRAKDTFQNIFIYRDRGSGFTFLRPLLYKMDLEISLELFKLFTQFGPPKEVYLNSCNVTLVHSIQQQMQGLCPMFSVQFLKSHSDLTHFPMYVVNEINNWMLKAKSDKWEIGCCVVQRKLNTQLIKDSEVWTAHSLFFGKAIEDTDLENETEQSNSSHEDSMLNTELEENASNSEEGQNDDEATGVIIDIVKKEYDEDESQVYVDEDISNTDVDPLVTVKEEKETEDIQELTLEFSKNKIVRNLRQPIKVEVMEQENET